MEEEEFTILEWKERNTRAKIVYYYLLTILFSGLFKVILYLLILYSYLILKKMNERITDS